MIAICAKEFSQDPYLLARNLERDPEQLSLVCVELLRYAEAKEAFASGDKARIKAWGDSPMMAMVEGFEFDAARKAMPVEGSE